MSQVKAKIYTSVTGYVEGVLTGDKNPRAFEAVVKALPIESVEE